MDTKRTIWKHDRYFPTAAATNHFKSITFHDSILLFLEQGIRWAPYIRTLTTTNSTTQPIMYSGSIMIMLSKSFNPHSSLQKET